jgi:hypothetical protein
MLYGPWVAILTSILIVPSVEGCFGWFNRGGYAGLLAHELYWACDCKEDPDDVRLTPGTGPFIRVGTFFLVP